MSSLQIGVLVDSALKQRYLQDVVRQVNHRVAYSAFLSAADPAKLANTDGQIEAWVVDVADVDPDSDELALPDNPSAADALLNSLLESATVPVILADSSEYPVGTEEHRAWLRRIAQRLERLSGDINLQETTSASSLWVLAASTGGPAAVKEFLAHLPPELGLAFVYVQHIDANYGATLVKMMSGAGHYPASLPRQGAVLQRDTLVLLTADQRVDIQENGTLLHSDRGWGGHYAPSVDQVAGNVARVYGERSGLIVFSGMGNDGVAGGRLVRQQGGQVWVQTPATCASDSMPVAVQAAGCAGFSGTPGELAQQLAEFVGGYTVPGKKPRRKALP